MIPAFVSEAFDVEALRADAATHVVIDPRGTILWVNEAWHQFARANGGQDIPTRFGRGASYLEPIADAIRGFFETAFSWALTTGKPFEHDYECSSPDLFRRFHMRALPVRGQGLVLEHSLVVEQAHDRVAVVPDDSVHVGTDGFVRQCAHCRRVARASGAVWDWIPSWVRKPPPKTSHGLCSSCLAFYWQQGNADITPR